MHADPSPNITSFAFEPLMATEVTGNTAEQHAKGEMQRKGVKPGKHPQKWVNDALPRNLLKAGKAQRVHVVANKSKAPWEGRKV